jgi:hypothetical protein
LEAQGCAAIEMGSISLIGALRAHYPGVLGRGFDRTQLEDHLPDGKKNALDAIIIRCVHDQNKLQPNGMRREVFWERAEPLGLTKSEVENVWNLFESTIPADGDIIAMVEARVPGFKVLVDIWQDTPLTRLKLNSVGIAIGHANAIRVVGFDADLGVWIR